MLPVLFSVGSLPVSSLGVFLVLALFYALFLVWRLARAWDIDEEKILDLAFTVGFGALISSRLYFVLQYFSFFSQDLSRVLAIFKYPGLSFWGAFLGGWLTLYFICRRAKMDFAQVIDISAVSFLGALILGDLGCFLGGCDIGVPLNFFFAVPMVGQVGKRFPVQLLEALLVGILLLRIWPKATHFHITGTVGSRVLIWVGVVKLFTEAFRATHQGGYFFSLVLIALGVSLHYRFSRRGFKRDLMVLGEIFERAFKDGKFRKLILQKITKNWYNMMQSSLTNSLIAIKWRFRNINKVLKKFNVKPTTKNS